jgi:hypothetical protein
MADWMNGTPPAGPSGKVLKMVHNPRMGGSVPAWVKAETAQEQIAANLASTQKPETFQHALSYQMQEPVGAEEEFGFLDLVDMVNPLQHIPLVNIAYRKLTGDEIKSASMVVGGAIFGGPAGAAGGIVNAIVKEETGKDIGDNALAMFSGDMPKFKKHTVDNPEVKLADALAGRAPDDLPVSLLAFTDRGITKSEAQNEIVIEFSPYEIY